MVFFLFMRLTVNQIMQQIAATVNQEATAPSAGGTEYILWLTFINRAVDEWAKAADWEETRKYFFPTITGVSQATVVMPLDFKNLAGPVRLHTAGGLAEGEEYPKYLEEDYGRYLTIDKYIKQVGNESTGFSLLFNPATLASGASVFVTYFSFPTSLASPTEVPMISDSQYLVDRSIAFIFESRSDPRFQAQETKARERLLNMVSMADESKYNSYSNPINVTNTMSRARFRMGRDG
jgi:hypothetical protein